MSIRILADESVNYNLIKTLRSASFEVISVLEKYPSVSDETVLALARDFAAILLTEDSDFGEWIFAHKAKTQGVIFLRYRSEELDKIVSALHTVLEKSDELPNRFVVLTAKKVRYRDVL